MSKDYYNILGVDKSASQDEIKKAFRKKAHEYHPDKKGGDEVKFKEINEAYQVLGNEQKRKQYDQFGSAFEHGQAGGAGFEGFGGFGNGSGFNINMDDLGDIFGGMGDIFGFSSRKNRGGERHSQGRDIQAIFEISFMEAVFGTEKELGLRKNVVCDNCKGNGAEPGSKIENCKTCGGRGSVSRVQRTIFGNMQVQMTCEDCQGEGKSYAQKCSKCSGSGVSQENISLKVKIPAGINNNETIRLSGQGEAGLHGASAGDLYLKIRVVPDNRFERDEYDIYSQKDINFTQAALGDKIKIETIDGFVNLKIPEGTQPGTTFKLRGKGVEKLRGRGRGDHFVKINVLVPKNLNRKQKTTLKELNV